MTMAANLEQAAHLSYSQTSIAYAGAALNPKFIAFVNAAAAIFDSDSNANQRTVGNWIIPMYALSSQLLGATPSQTQYNQMVEYLYRICYAGLFAASDNRITASQATALLAAWNTQFGT